MTDVTDATFENDVIERSKTVPVVVDLWAPWCGPCKQLGPILERAVAATAGRVELVKINVDDNPQAAQAFRVQSIPAVYAMADGAVVDGFVGAQGEAEVTDFVQRLLPTEEESQIDALIERGDEASLEAALEIEPDNEAAILALARLRIEQGRSDEVGDLLAKIPESTQSRHLAALARTGGEGAGDDVEQKLDALLERIPGDDEARQDFVDLLEVLGPDDPRTATYRKRLTSKLY